MSYNVWFETNFTKKYYANFNLFLNERSFYKGRSIEYSGFHRYRFNDHISISHSAYYRPYKNDIGFYSTDGSSSKFSLRNRNVVENTLEAKYSFNNKSGISIIGRHYWSEVENKTLFNLNDEGHLTEIAAANSFEHQNYNNFYINMVYTWQFSPGSFLNIVWKDEASTFDGNVRYRYLRNFDRTVAAPQNNNLSIKLVYYLDYLDLRKRKAKTEQSRF